MCCHRGTRADRRSRPCRPHWRTGRSRRQRVAVVERVCLARAVGEIDERQCGGVVVPRERGQRVAVRADRAGEDPGVVQEQPRSERRDPLVGRQQHAVGVLLRPARSPNGLNARHGRGGGADRGQACKRGDQQYPAGAPRTRPPPHAASCHGARGECSREPPVGIDGPVGRAYGHRALRRFLPSWPGAL